MGSASLTLTVSLVPAVTMATSGVTCTLGVCAETKPDQHRAEKNRVTIVILFEVEFLAIQNIKNSYLTSQHFRIFLKEIQ